MFAPMPNTGKIVADLNLFGDDTKCTMPNKTHGNSYAECLIYFLSLVVNCRTITIFYISILFCFKITPVKNHGDFILLK